MPELRWLFNSMNHRLVSLLTLVRAAVVLPWDKKIPAQGGMNSENDKAILGSFAQPQLSSLGELSFQGYNSIRGA